MCIDLDERIIKGKKPLTAFDEIDSKFIGTDCYFSDKASDYGDLSNCQIASLLRKDEETGVFSATKNNSYAVFNFCLPCEWVEEEQILPKIDFESAKKDPNFEQCEIYGNELLYDTKNHVFYTSDGKIHFCLTHVAQRYAREERENEVDVIAEKKYRPYRLRVYISLNLVKQFTYDLKTAKQMKNVWLYFRNIERSYIKTRVMMLNLCV